MNIRERYKGTTPKQVYELLIDTLYSGQVRPVIEDIRNRMGAGPFFQPLYERLSRDLDVLNDIAKERGQNP
jgi:hypothetical protein